MDVLIWHSPQLVAIAALAALGTVGGPEAATQAIIAIGSLTIPQGLRQRQGASRHHHLPPPERYDPDFAPSPEDRPKRSI